MTELGELLQHAVDDGVVPGAVGLLARDGGTDAEVVAAGWHDVERSAPMERDTLFRIASITKPITAAAVLTLVDDGRLALDDAVATWLPELVHPVVVRTPDGPLDDVVPAERALTVEDLLTFRCGWGFPDAFNWPAVQALFAVQPDGREVQALPSPDAWLAALATVPMVHQPGEHWHYNTGSDLQGCLLARVLGQPFPEVLAERVLEPLGMDDTAFAVAPADRARLPTAYRNGEKGLEVTDPPDGQFTTMPAFPSGAGGLVSTVDDWAAFGRMLLAGGRIGDRQLLREESVRRMTTDHLSAEARASSRLFLEGQGWGHGGSVDIDAVGVADAWTVPGRYGWVGGSGTSAHVVPSHGTMAILLTQRYLDDPVPPSLLRDFWTLAARYTL